MESAIRFSQNSLPGTPQRFMYVDVTGKSFKLCKITGQNQKTLQYDTICTSTKVPAFRAFDWHPLDEDLVVVGQAGGEATLLNIAEGQQDSLSFQVRSQRLCNAVALNTQNLLAAGLDKVRTDFCLNIWDFNQRLPAPGSKGFSKTYSDPLHKLASGEPITSLKFFQDDPQLLVAGVKGQFVRLYDLREPTVGNGLQFATRCVHNLAIDWRDENFFASCYPTNDPSICVWDRRMITCLNPPHMSFGGSLHSENRQPVASLELKNVIETLGTIWSLRFSKAERGCLGVLSSTGHLKVYHIGKDFVPETCRIDRDAGHDLSWETSPPQDVFLDRAQDVAKQYSYPSAPRDEKSRVVSFDFMTSTNKLRQSEIITLDGNGVVRVTSTSPTPEPTALSSVGFLCKGEFVVTQSTSEGIEPGHAIDQVRRRAQPRNLLKQAFKQSRQNKTPSDQKRMSSLDDQAWHADLGFYEKDVPLPDFLMLTSIQRLRCEAGYLLNPSKNKIIVSDSHWLQTFWAWVERAAKISRNGNMTQDNFDLSYAGVYGLWMEDIDPQNRTRGPSSSKLAKIIENLVRRLNIPRVKDIATEYMANRQICLHSAGLAWSYEELEMIVKRLVAQNQHTKAAALAIFAVERKLAYKALRSKNANQSHKMLAMAIAGAARRVRSDEDGPTTGDDSDTQNDWVDTISSLADELTDPYARAILAYVKTGDWSNVVSEGSLPLKYRVCVALRHLDDSKLTRYISQATKDALAEGDIEGVILTGTATPDAFELMAGYLRRFGDLQTAVLALCPAIPRYVDEEKVVRKFSAWKDAYRNMMNGWNLKFDRVRFDIACQNAAIDESGRRLISPAKQQIRLVCGFCAQGIAHSVGLNGESSPGHKVVETSQHPLTKEKAAAIGTVCPKCGRHLPRCGVCDLWLGVPDDSYLPWYGQQHGLKHNPGKVSLDLSASMTGSVQTTIGPGAPTATPKGTESPRPKQPQRSQGNSKASETTESSTRTAIPASHTTLNGTEAVPRVAGAHPGTENESEKVEAVQRWDTAMSRFTVLCVKCSHGFHAAHARMQDLALVPLQYPHILGSDVAGVVQKVGEAVTRFKPGDRVIGGLDTVLDWLTVVQSMAVSNTTRLAARPWFFHLACPLRSPLFMGILDSNYPASRQTRMIRRSSFGGRSSSMGSVAIQLAVASGYEVITAASARNHEYVKALGAAEAFDQATPGVVDLIVQRLKKSTLAGVYDCIGLESTTRSCADILSQLGGGVLPTVLWPPSDLPGNVKPALVNATDPGLVPDHVGAKLWKGYVPAALEAGKLLAKPEPKVVVGGLDAIQDAMEMQKKGVSAQKIVVEM
ncbi:uncharacterized protein Z518_04122 [Rhinocladiella mackenziei CBS 650.93]|uniref:Uncharacterized protein n=1 Tax=Rhinocladiella mackenziei CBS 650.93 TaxID=1442369 RepID=A0A0D2H6W4_9EURO|nr:uncharacterized protein Z518_04122 [Rhinocladiella mackenziei CBS 650.93]KIX06148.1 hypothetical protein Z518_04122 [Rhinocladiella mackenziei CBS 650.93]